jgi:hypothetical protein
LCDALVDDEFDNDDGLAACTIFAFPVLPDKPRLMFSFALVTTDGEVLGVSAYAKRWLEAGRVIPQGSASVRVVDVIKAGTTPMEAR